jgi:hypothetical protein
MNLYQLQPIMLGLSLLLITALIFFLILRRRKQKTVKTLPALRPELKESLQVNEGLSISMTLETEDHPLTMPHVSIKVKEQNEITFVVQEIPKVTSAELLTVFGLYDPTLDLSFAGLSEKIN